MAKNFELIQRRTLRGLKKCPSCGHVQGMRKLICGNETCPLRQKMLATQIPYDPVKLVTKNNSLTTTLFSLRIKERETSRSFIEIKEIPIGSSTLSKYAICYVESCKNDIDTTNGYNCKHVNACRTDKSIPSAEVYPLAKEVLWNLNIDAVQKQRLWNSYSKDDIIPAIQRLNTTTFVVKCEKSKVFPAGRLHVNVFATKKHACACKKLKIILEADNSVVMQEEICDHLILVLSAVLSKTNGKHVYKNFINSLKSFWMPTELEKPLRTQEDAFFGLDINIGGNFAESIANAIAADDIFIFDEKFLTDDNFPDFTDIVLDLTPSDLLTAHQQQSNTTVTTTTSNSNTISAPLLLHAGDPNLVSSCNINEEDVDIRFDDLTLTTHAKTANAVIDEVDIDCTAQLELSDCNIELMDEFQLTDRIDLCSDDIDLPDGSTPLFDSVTNSINILTSDDNTEMAQPAIEHEPITISLPQSSSNVPFYSQGVRKDLSNVNSGSLLKTSHNLLPSTTLEAPPIELPTITVVEKTPVKVSQIVSEVNTRKYPHIPAKRALIVNAPLTQLTSEPVMLDTEPSLAFSTWLDYVIETINDSIEINEQTERIHTFHVHEEIFSHFSKSFSVGIKRRMPNTTTVVKTGKHKGLIKYTWYFPTAATVRRIFSTKNISLQIERAFEKTGKGEFIPYVRPLSCDINQDTKKKRIYPKLSLYMAQIWFDCNSKDHKTGLKIEWLPNAFPKSHFGILKIEFSLGIKDPFNLRLD